MARVEKPNPKLMQNKREKRPRAQTIPRWLYYGGAALALALVAFVAYNLIPSRRPIDSAFGTVGRQTASEVRVGLPAPDLTFTTIDGTKHQLSEFRGQPVMLWLFATWCPTCQAGTTALAQNLEPLKQAGLQIVQLKLYNNLGFQGPSVEEFARRYAGLAYPLPNWLWGEASQDGSYTYDPKGYPDIYFLIDRDGILQTINSAPNVTLDQILTFARSVH